jgi:hypothetical protein
VKAVQIGIVANRIGLSVDAIRFYERNALLPRPPRTQGGFRQYAESDIETLALSAAYRGWDLNSARFTVFWICEEAAYSHVRLCAAGWKKSSLTYSESLPTYTS